MLSLVCPTVHCFSTLSHTRHDFRNKILNIKCVFWFSLQCLSEIFLIRRRIQRYVIRNVCWHSCKFPVILDILHWNVNFLNSVSKNTAKPYFMKIRSVGAQLFHADGRRDMTILIVDFRIFAIASKNGIILMSKRFSFSWRAAHPLNNIICSFGQEEEKDNLITLIFLLVFLSACMSNFKPRKKKRNVRRCGV